MPPEGYVSPNSSQATATDQTDLIRDCRERMMKEFNHFEMGLLTPAETFDRIREITGRYKIVKIEIEQLQSIS